MNHPTLTSALALEPSAHIRNNSDAIARLLLAPETRHMMLIASKPLIRSSPDRSQAGIRWFTGVDVQALGLELHTALFLGLTRDSGAARFVLTAPEMSVDQVPHDLHPAVDLRTLATQGVMASEELSVIGLAKSLNDWHHTNSHCCCCGSATESRDAGWRRQCGRCGHVSFPRIDPVVIMLVTDGPRVVLVRQPHFPPGMYSLPAGFIEPGEDIEQAVHRETLEEVGLAVDTVRYELSQPWPFPHSLMIGCLAECRGGEAIPDPGELEAGRWFSRDEVRAMVEGNHMEMLWVPGAQAIAHTLITRWLQNEGT